MLQYICGSYINEANNTRFTVSVILLLIYQVAGKYISSCRLWELKSILLGLLTHKVTPMYVHCTVCNTLQCIEKLMKHSYAFTKGSHVSVHKCLVWFIFDWYNIMLFVNFAKSTSHASVMSYHTSLETTNLLKHHEFTCVFIAHE